MNTISSARPLPDLTLSKLQSTPTVPKQGDSVTFSIEVHNRGNANAGPFALSAHVDTSGDMLDANLAGLEAGGKKTVKLGPVKMDYNNQSMAWVQVEADSVGQVQESEEGNNTGWIMFTNPTPWPPAPPPFPPSPPFPHP